jgi:hypothetical protein
MVASDASTTSPGGLAPGAASVLVERLAELSDLALPSSLYAQVRPLSSQSVALRDDEHGRPCAAP